MCPDPLGDFPWIYLVIYGGEKLVPVLVWMQDRYPGLGIKGMVMGSDRNLLGIIGNLLGIIGNLLGELWAFLWKCELIKCLIIVPFIYNSIDLIVASVELHLNASALSSPNSLTLQLTSDLIPSITIATLVDSSSTHFSLTLHSPPDRNSEPSALHQFHSGFSTEPQILLSVIQSNC